MSLNFKIFEDCKLVSGRTRSIIYDLTRKKYGFLTKEEHEWAKDLDKKNWNIILNECDDEIKEFAQNMISNEFAFLCPESQLENFPPISNTWFDPALISNAILIRSNRSSFHLSEFFSDIEELGCRHLQILLIEQIDLENLQNLFEDLKILSLKSIELIIPKEMYLKEYFKKVTSICNNVLTIYVTNCESFSIQGKKEEVTYNTISLNNDIREIFTHNSPDPNFFVIDIRLFTESRLHNTFFNRKLIVDHQDNILNAINGSSFGTIQEGNIFSIVSKEDFQKLWNISKDLIEPCKHCEYRNMCVDSRTPVLTEGKWGFETSCDYDPVNGVWDKKTENA